MALPQQGTRLLEVLRWKDVRKEVQLVNRELADIIDEIDPSDNFKLVKASYAFGDLLVKHGVVQFPTASGKLLPLADPEVDSSLTTLSYSPIPLFLTLEKDNEVFIDTGTRAIPLNLFHCGSLLGLFESIDFMFGRESLPQWSVSAGSRSIIMLPKITNDLGLKRLRMRYGFPATTRLKCFSDHWEVFSKIANHPDFGQPWQNTVLFFTKDWLVQESSSKGWDKFKDYLFRQTWRQAQAAMVKTDLSSGWESFAGAISARNLKPRPYLADHVKHILLIATSKSPAFRPVDNSQQAAPIDGLQKAFIDTYLLKQYLPTFMHCCSLDDIANSLPVYYSLSLPTLLEGSPLNKISSTIMVDLRDIKLLIDTLKVYSKMSNAFEKHIIHNSQFDYFHVEQDKYSEVQSSLNIPKDDSVFLTGAEQLPEYSFCSTSSFWRGCVRIQIKKP